MKLVVDLTRCQGYAQCAFLAPERFTMHGDEALLYDPDPGDAQREHVLRAAAACPVQAILLDRVGSRNGPAGRCGAPSRGAPERTDDGFRRTRADRDRRGLAGRAAGRGGAARRGLHRLADPDRGRARRALRPAAAVQTGAQRLRCPADTPRCPGAMTSTREWRLGVPATRLDLAGQQVRLADGDERRVRPSADRHRRAGPAVAQPGRGRAGRRVSSCAPATTPSGCQRLWPRGRAGCWSSAPGSPVPRSPRSAASWACR